MFIINALFNAIKGFKNFFVATWLTSNVPNRIVLIVSIIIMIIIAILRVVPIFQDRFPPDQNPIIYWLLIILALLVIFLIGTAIILEIINLSSNPLVARIKFGFFIALIILFLWQIIPYLPGYSDSTGDSDSSDPAPITENKINFGFEGKDFLISENANCPDYMNERKELDDESFDGNMENRYDTYLDLCPNDPEVQIYYSNLLAKKSKNHIAIAVTVPISREKEARDSQEILRGVAIAQDEWNKNKDHQDLQILIAIADDGNKDGDRQLESAEAIAELLIDKKEILGVVGHFSSDATEYVAPIYKENNLVAISPTSTAVREKTDLNKNDHSECINNENRNAVCLNSYIFRTASNDSIHAKKVVDTIQYNDLVAIVYEKNSTYSRSFKSAFEGTISEENLVKIESDACDFSKYGSKENPKICLNKIKEIDVKTNKLLLIPTSKNKQYIDDLIKENSLSSNKLNLLGSDSMYKKEFVKDDNTKARKDTEGMLVSVPWHRDDSECDNGAKRLECKATKLFHNRNYDENELVVMGVNIGTISKVDS